MFWKNSVCLVSGGASGLGKATVERFIELGAKVLLCDLQSSISNIDLIKQKQLNAAINDKQLLLVPVDVTNTNDITTALNLCKEQFGKLNIVVNCAGIGVAYKTYNFNKQQPHQLDDFIKVMNVNTIGTFNIIRLSCQLLGLNQLNQDNNNERGCIVNTASIAAYDGQCGQAAYAASKGAICSMTLPIARDLSTHAIRVNTIAPGLFNTPLLSQLPDKVKSFLSRSVPFPQRLGEPHEFAHLVQTICENQMLNGEIIRLDGALRMQP